MKIVPLAKVVLAYRPPAHTKQAKRRKRRAKRVRQNPQR